MKDIKKWINERLAADISDSRFDELWNFVVLWNIFEAEVFERDFRVHRIEDIDWTLDANYTRECLDWLIKRYIDTTTGDTNSSFKRLKLTGDREIFVKEVLTGKKTYLSDIQKGIILIINRYRNNLFHGEKSFSHFPSYAAIFPFACEYLIECIKKQAQTITI